MGERGYSVHIEGGDGTGKTTVANLAADRFRSYGREVIRVDEPDSAYDEAGDTLVPIASELRCIIKNGTLTRSPLTNLLLFTAARLENWEQVTRPALAAGVDVISARDNISSEAYQGFGEGYSRLVIRALTRFALGSQYMHPDFCFILDLDDEAELQRRIASRGQLEVPDTFESKDDEFQRRVREGYRSIARRRRIPLVSIEDKTPEEVTNELFDRMKLPFA